MVPIVPQIPILSKWRKVERIALAVRGNDPHNFRICREYGRCVLIYINPERKESYLKISHSEYRIIPPEMYS